MDRAFASIKSENIGKFRRRLLNWYQKNQRTLPWRGEADPYRILVSEIMLQQTRVAVVEDRYKKFVAQFPTAERLSRAKETTVLAAWSGLGYYRRARALHQAAKDVVSRRGFPRTSAEILELPGVGRYTAAAVASIAFGEPTAVVDGNVKRVIDRVAAHKANGGKSAVEAAWQIAGDLLDKRRPGDFNQAMMELGATVCLPGQPLCHACPVSLLCASRGPTERSERQARKKAVIHYGFHRKNGSVLLQQRAQENSLMPGMWELPGHEPSGDDRRPLLKLRHSITTTDYTVFVHEAEKQAGEGRWVSLRAVHRLPLTGLTRKIIARLADA